SKSDYGSIYKIRDDKVTYVDAVGHDLKLLKSLQINKSVFSVHTNEPQILDNLLERDKNMISQEKYEVLKSASKNIEQSLTFSLTVDNERIAGISLDINDKSKKQFMQDDIETLAAFRNLAESFYTFQRYNKLQGDFQRDIILSMIKFLEVHDKYTGGHSEEVANLSIMIAKSLDLSKKEINNAYWAGLIHDIGKLLIPKKILNKKQKLTDSDYSLIQNHPYWAYTALKQTKKLDSIAKYVLYHHERWDGEGYPEGVKREQIPLISRIIAVADAYSAMTSDRAYRDALSKQEAFQELKKGSKKQFDPEIVKILITNIDSLDKTNVK
ncbi:MAG: HD-GYP domain-containing protein, partial [Halanaerobiales bacterium]|nr:HD-GYP domain-containing protein [Halanaerobiales bacterium]